MTSPGRCCASWVDVWVEPLTWGNENEIQNLQEKIQQWTMEHNIDDSTTTTTTAAADVNSSYVDYIWGADIIYPTTCNEVIDLLFNTIQTLLCPIRGVLILSFCTRDGYKTPIRLLQAATKAGYALIQSISSGNNNNNNNDRNNNDDMDSIKSQYSKLLPPLLDSQLLIFQRRSDEEDAAAATINACIGTEECTIFPKLYQQQANAIEQQQNNQRTLAMQNNNNNCWDDLPFGSSSSSDDDDNNDDDDDDQ